MAFIVQWLTNLLTGWGAAPDLVNFLLALLGAVVLPLLAMLFVIFLIWYERKMYGRIQDRLGPEPGWPVGNFPDLCGYGQNFHERDDYARRV